MAGFWGTLGVAGLNEGLLFVNRYRILPYPVPISLSVWLIGLVILKAPPHRVSEER